MDGKTQIAQTRALLKAATTVRTAFNRDAVGEALGFKDALAMQVLLQLSLTDGLTRKELAEKLHASQPNVSNSVVALASAGLVVTRVKNETPRTESLFASGKGARSVTKFLDS